jgi:hypothetical protein
VGGGRRGASHERRDNPQPHRGANTIVPAAGQALGLARPFPPTA